MIDLSSLSRIWHPEAGHDRGKAPYFEGWYVKMVAADRQFRMAVIPGLFRSDDGSAEAFVQVLDGDSGKSWYVPYPATEYRAAKDRFGAVVGPNRFTATRISLGIDEQDLSLSGEVNITDPLDRWPVSVRSPGAMGWYAYAPAMECYHGVVSFRHGLSGVLNFNGKTVDLAGGRGYIEQDWGQAFPAAYVWMHSNHFSNPDLSLLASAALIPWWRGKFRGLLIGLRYGEDFHRFATYTGAKTEQFSIDDDHVRLTVRDRKGFWLRLVAERRGGALLHAPIRTQMHRRVEETLDARIHLEFGRGSESILEDTGEVAGLEVHGEIPTLLGTADR